ncbi:MAG: site-specific DNA-methyltransferase [Clostridia bacterium]|nr:site-specific DNA-methyltransferase [Clostridia bacterium]
MPTLNWIGKDKVINHHLDVPFRTLEKQYTFASEGQDDGGNMIIHGDNLDALKALLPKYEGRVKCIYIDPPYNTGNEGWVYNDNVNDPKIRKWLGEVVGKEGEDLSRHDKWLCMMYPRLKLLHKLLAEDGAIFISIDDIEFSYLQLLCSEIFGQRNHVATFIWQKRYSPDVRTSISDAHEFVLCYTKNPEMFKERRHLLPLTESQTKQFSNPDNDPRGPWKANDFTAPGYRPNQMYEITLPSGRIVTPPTGRCWRVTKEGFDQFVAEDKMIYGNNGDGVPAVKRFLSEMPGMVPWTWWNHEEVGHTQEGNKLLAAIMGKAVFDYPKPVRLVERIMQIATDPDSIILDSFAGSGTTAHAVLNMNKQDGGHRKFILVEMMDYADSITAERVKRVISGYGEGKKVVPGTDGGFSFYELGEPLLVDGLLNPNVEESKIREYVYYTETRQPMPEPSADEKHLLGVHDHHAYYFYYEPDQLTTLNKAFLRTIKTRAESYLIYADVNMLSAEEMEKFHISFKKIPRDIALL